MTNIHAEDVSLHELGLKYHLDKAYAHEYTLEFYPRHLEAIRRSAELIVEVGVWDGGSLRMWSEYFDKARLLGIDINFSRIKAPVPRCSLRYADQSKPEELKLAFSDIARDSVDMIIEDGMHTSRCQQICFGFLFPFVKPGGRYIIEDLQSSVSWPGEKEEQITSLEMLNNMQHTGEVDSLYMPQDEKSYIRDNMGEIDIYTKTPEYDKSVSAVIYKRT